ncbi:MAG TPA: DMT family transporter [Clostridiales bacterium]|nr:DMT family transporter [Clostridiales bacterium]
MDKRKTGMTFAILSAIAWGTYGTFYSILLEKGITDLTLVALAPFALVVYFGLRVLFKPHVLKAIPLKYYIGMALQGFLIVNAFNYCYSQAYANGMAVGIVSVVAFTNVLVIMVESYFILKYKFTMAKVVSMVLALAGLSLVLEIYSGGSGVFTVTGLLWTLLIPLFYGTNVTLNSFFIVKGCDTDAILFITQLAAMVFMVLFQIHPPAIAANLTAVVRETPSVIWPLLGFCTLPMIFCYAMMQECLKRLEPSIMGIIYSLDPVTSFTLGLIVFGQPIRGLQIVGIVMIIAAVVYINFAEGREAKGEDRVDQAASSDPVI